jgi:hypothetical protein
MFSLHLIIVSVLAFSSSRSASARELILLCSLIPLADTLLLLNFVGIFPGTILLTIVCLYFLGRRVHSARFSKESWELSLLRSPTARQESQTPLTKGSHERDIRVVVHMSNEKPKRWLKRTLLAFFAFAVVIVTVLWSLTAVARARGVREVALPMSSLAARFQIGADYANAYEFRLKPNAVNNASFITEAPELVIPTQEAPDGCIRR